jgi:hypothetical protein
MVSIVWRVFLCFFCVLCFAGIRPQQSDAKKHAVMGVAGVTGV